MRTIHVRDNNSTDNASNRAILCTAAVFFARDAKTTRARTSTGRGHVTGTADGRASAGAATRATTTTTGRLFTAAARPRGRPRTAGYVARSRTRTLNHHRLPHANHTARALLSLRNTLIISSVYISVFYILYRRGNIVITYYYYYYYYYIHQTVRT